MECFEQMGENGIVMSIKHYEHKITKKSMEK